MRKFLPIVALLFLAATGCRETEKVDMDLGMYESDRICLMVKGKNVFTFTEENGQLAYNRTLMQFRAGNDDMTSFFVLTCKALPRKEGEEILADLEWTSGNSVKSTRNITFKVEKTDGTGLVWLWNAADKTGAGVKILN